MTIISSYDVTWPEKFSTEKKFLFSIINQWVIGSIEHVGSTSVVGLAAKPVIDIMVGVESLENSKDAIAILTHNGYCYAPYKTDIMHWLCKPSPELRTHHLHLIPFESELWHERIKFRDILRSNKAVALEYQQLKLHLAKVHANDREKYTASKGPFVNDVLSGNKR